jgi:hypothetical protein
MFVLFFHFTLGVLSGTLFRVQTLFSGRSSALQLVLASGLALGWFSSLDIWEA